MISEEREARLNDYIDGLLSPGEMRSVEDELARNPEYQALEQSLRALLDGAARLPREVTPERDLWPGVEAGLTGKPAPVARGRRGFPPAVRYGMLAASLAAVFLAGFLVARSYGPYPPAGGHPQMAELQAVEAEYTRARSVLLQALDDSRSHLTPETQAVLDENLAIIASAIREIHAALEKDPGNPQLIRSLVVAYDREVELLQQATQLPAQT